MKHEAKINNLPNGQIGLRHFHISQIETVEATGTDRNSQAQVYEGDCDSRGIHAKPEEVTYLRIVDTSLDVPMCVPKARKQIGLIDSLDYLGHLSTDKAHLLYDPRKITRASENEFWFTGDARESLIAVVTIKQKP
ncbi:MAG: hypothetical protein WC503_01775 [Candidatus Shapirobacteria bacterium]